MLNIFTKIFLESNGYKRLVALVLFALVPVFDSSPSLSQWKPVLQAVAGVLGFAGVIQAEVKK